MPKIKNTLIIYPRLRKGKHFFKILHKIVEIICFVIEITPIMLCFCNIFLIYYISFYFSFLFPGQGG